MKIVITHVTNQPQVIINGPPVVRPYPKMDVMETTALTSVNLEHKIIEDKLFLKNVSKA